MVVSRPTLYVLGVNHKYEEIVERLEKNETSSLEWEDMYGNTVLHILCRHATLNRGAIAAVVQKRPRMVGHKNRASWTPLHLACERRLSLHEEHHRDADLLLLLIRACPEAVSTPRDSGCARETPFDMACAAGADASVLRAMLRIDPALALPQRHAHCPAKAPLLVLGKAMGGPAAAPHMALVALTAFRGRAAAEGGASAEYLLHAACAHRVPTSYFSQVLEAHGEQQLLQPDPCLGNLPLHCAVSQRDLPPAAMEFIVAALVEAAPGAADVANRAGRYPLHCALANNHHRAPILPWGGSSSSTLGGQGRRRHHHLLCRSVALHTQDRQTGLFPLQMAALGATKSRLHHSALYEIILAAPDVVTMTGAAVAGRGERKEEGKKNEETGPAAIISRPKKKQHPRPPPTLTATGM